MKLVLPLVHPRTISLAALLTGSLLASACKPQVEYREASGGSGGSAGSGGSGGTAPTGGSSGSGGVPDSGGNGGTLTSGGAGGTTANGGAGGTAPNGGSVGGTMADASSGGAGGTTIPDAAVEVDTAPPPPSRGPTPSIPGHKYPFPQNRENSRCIYPDLYRNEDVKTAYEKWKNDTVTSDGAKGYRRVKRPNEPSLEPNSTVSEGIAYGMILAVYMDDQDLFDDLWMYEQQFLDSNTYLMNWYIKADGSGVGENPAGVGPATDADEDMAFALVMADKQWGGKGKLARTYLDWAQETIGKIWSSEINAGKYLLPWPADGIPAINLSYFAPAFYKIFAKVDPANANGWKSVVDTMYEVLSKSLNSSSGNASNGLVPAWCDAEGNPKGDAFGSGGASPTNYQYDSCRMPFRIALDYCWFGDPRAKDYLEKTSSFFSNIGATKIVDGYALNGAPQPEHQKDDKASMQSSAFVGPAGVGAMSNPIYQTFVDDAYGVLVKGDALVGGTYYDESWMVMSMLMMTGNYVDYTSLQPIP